MTKNEQLWNERLSRHLDELKWLYMELYDSQLMFDDLCVHMKQFFMKRKPSLKKLDADRLDTPDWYRSSDMFGMMMYTDNFADTLKGVQSHLNYIKQCGVNYLHLMPLLASPAGRSDGGYAVSDFRSVQPQLGTMEDLEKLAAACHRQGISLCLDFVMNHTSEDHEWALRAKKGEQEYQDRYFFYNDYTIPAQYEKTVPQVFPTTAPGNFTWLEGLEKFVMTTFYPYQWDLNYHNPVVFNEMMYNFLYLANKGIDVIRIDAVPYIWKELGTDCRNLPKVHTIVRMMRMISEIVCPGILLLGEVVMEPEKVAPYFGTVEKPECHMLYNVTTMATIWNTVATADTRLLKKQLEIIRRLPESYTFLNYLRCHDDIGWGLDYPALKDWGMEQVPHKKFLNDFFTGKLPESFARGELYNEDPVTGDARLCGTAASLCGIEKAGFEQDMEGLSRAIRLDIMLHGFLLFLSGIPMLYSGDEIGQVNDYTYKDDPDKAPDSRYLHRGKFRWELVKEIQNPHTVQYELFNSLNQLEQIRKQEPLFHASVPFFQKELYDNSLLYLIRGNGDEQLLGIFNFSQQEKTVGLEIYKGTVQDMLTGEITGDSIKLNGFGFKWLKYKI